MSLWLRAIPALALCGVPVAFVWWMARRRRGALEDQGGRIALLGSMTFALAAALELGLGGVLRGALEGRAVGAGTAAIAVGCVVAAAHEPLRFFTYRNFLPGRGEAGEPSASSALLYGLGWGAAMAGLAGFSLLVAFGLAALGGDGVRAIGFGDGIAHRADLRSAFAGVEPWRVWVMMADALAWASLQVGLARLVARGRVAHLVAAFIVHAAAVTTAALLRDGDLEGLVPFGLVVTATLLYGIGSRPGSRPTGPPGQRAASGRSPRRD